MPIFMQARLDLSIGLDFSQIPVSKKPHYPTKLAISMVSMNLLLRSLASQTPGRMRLLKTVALH